MIDKGCAFVFGCDYGFVVHVFPFTMID